MGKKHRLTAAIAFFVILTASFSLPTRSHAAGMSIGPYVWYAWWIPSFKEYSEGKNLPFGVTNPSFTMNPAFLYGPMLSFNWGNWSWSNVLVLGQYSSKSKFNSISITPPPLMPTRGSNKTWKFDLDSTINYSVNKNIKIFIGFKYQHYNYKGTQYINFGPAAILNKISDTYHGFGLGFGTGFTFHLVENLFLIWNLSITGYCPFIKSRQTGMIMFPTYNQPLNNPKEQISTAFGPNSTLTFAYYIPKANLTLSLGFRYQYMYFIGARIPASNMIETPESHSDHFFGVNMSVVYSFNFGKDTEEEDES